MNCLMPKIGHSIKQKDKNLQKILDFCYRNNIVKIVKKKLGGFNEGKRYFRPSYQDYRR